jgi:hypothetical protein
MVDASILSFYELSQATIIPIWVMDGVEPMVMGDKVL